MQANLHHRFIHQEGGLSKQLPVGMMQVPRENELFSLILPFVLEKAVLPPQTHLLS